MVHLPTSSHLSSLYILFWNFRNAMYEFELKKGKDSELELSKLSIPVPCARVPALVAGFYPT